MVVRLQALCVVLVLVLVAHRSYARIDTKIFENMLPHSMGDHLQSDRTLWGDPVLPLVPYDSEYTDSHAQTMATAKAWAADAKSQATKIAEEASLIKDRVAGWSQTTLENAAKAQKSAVDASLACFEAIKTADKYAPRPAEERLKTEITLRDLVVKAVHKASNDIRGQVAKEAGEQVAREVAATAAQETGRVLGVQDPNVLAAAQELLREQITPGAITAAEQEARSTKAEGVVLQVAEAAANWGVRKVTLTGTSSDTAVMFAAKDDALAATKKATRLLCHDAALRQARESAELGAQKAVRDAVVQSAEKGAHAAVEAATAKAQEQVSSQVTAMAEEAGKTLVVALHAYGLSQPTKATQSQNFGMLQAPTARAAREAAAAAAKAESHTLLQSIGDAVRTGMDSSPPVPAKVEELLQGKRKLREAAVASGLLAAKQTLAKRVPLVTLSTAASMIAQDVMLKVDVSALLVLPSISELQKAAAEASWQVRQKILSKADNTSSTDPAVLRAAIKGANRALASLSAPSVVSMAHRAAATICSRVLNGASEDEEKADVAARAAQEAQIAAEQTATAFVTKFALRAAHSEAVKAADRVLGGSIAERAVQVCIDAMSSALAHNASSFTVKSLARQAAQQAVKQGAADPAQEELAASSAYDAAIQPAHTAALEAVRRVITRPELVHKATAVARGAIADDSSGQPQQAAQALVNKFLHVQAGFEARRAAEGAALGAAAPLVSQAAKQGAKHQLAKQIASAAVQAVERGPLQSAVAQALTEVAAAEAKAQVARLGPQVGITAPSEITKMEATAAQTITKTADLGALQVDAVQAGLTAAARSAQQLVDQGLAPLHTEDELSHAEAELAQQTRAAAQQAALITAQTAAREMAKARLMDPEVAAAVLSELSSATRADLAGHMAARATEELAESVSEEVTEQARQSTIPAAIGEAMSDASKQLVDSKQASDVQLAMAARPALHTLEQAVQAAVKDAARGAVKAVVTSDVAAMVRAAVDHAIAISKGDNPKVVAQDAATQTVRSVCMGEAAAAATQAATKSAKAAARMMAQETILKTVQLEEAKRAQ